jgi:wyosine [tRNA(Phe)-imidazoG37] synthetase (radical SAM superfamily)
MPDEPRPKGLMELSDFESILQKIGTDRPDTPIVIHLFNWGEPLLHPELPAFIEAIRRRGWQSIVSTTLNISRGLDRLVEAAPDILKISLSAWSQDDYAQTHARGDIARVKENLRLLRQLMDTRSKEQQTLKPIFVMIGYHLYKHNQAEASTVKAFSEQLDFHYTENNAVIQPVERNIDLLAGRADKTTKAIAEKLILHPKDLSILNRQRRSGQFDCELRFNMTAINVYRSVALCCGTFSKSLQIHDDFLNVDVQALENAKYSNSFCAECMQCGFAYTVNDVM